MSTAARPGPAATLALGCLVLLGACAGGRDDAVDVSDLAVRRVVVGTAAWGVALEGATAWVSSPAAGEVLQLDDEGNVLRSLPTGAADPRDAGMALSGGRLWVANLGGSVGVLDSASGEVLGRVGVAPGEPAGVAVEGNSAWVPLHGPEGGLARIDADTLELAIRVELAESAFAAVVDGGSVWVAGLDRRVFEIDAATGEVTRSIEAGAAPRGIAVTPEAVWVTLRDDRQLVRLDRGSGEVVDRISLDGAPWPVAVGAGSVWVGLLDGQLLRVDPESGEVTGRGAIDPEARSVAVGTGEVWVASQAGVVSRVAVDGS